jgi:hypothetical protein
MNYFAYMRPFLKVMMLGAALELGIIDRLCEAGEPLSVERLCSELSLHPRGCLLLLRLLAAHGIVELDAGRIRPAPAFEADYRSHGDAIREITRYMRLAYGDLQQLSEVVRSGEARGNVHDFWHYGRDVDTSAQHGSLLRSVTGLQGERIVPSLQLRGDERLLDVGGNDGELALQICRRYPDIRCGVFDLEAVCRLGEERLRVLPESPRIDFHPGDLRVDELPGRPDVITVKSVLNDWPDAEALAILNRARRALPENGRLLVIEHMTDGAPDRDALLFDLVFMYLIAPEGRFRSGEEYERLLGEAGFADITRRRAGFLDFQVVEGRKPG